MASGEDLLTSPDVGRLLGISARTVIRRVEAGLLVAAQKLPGPQGAYLFRRADVEQYIAQQRARSDEGAPDADTESGSQLPRPRVPPATECDALSPRVDVA